MPLPPTPPPVIAFCPLRDSVQARAAGDSAGKRVNTEGHILAGITTGVVGGISGLFALGGNGTGQAIFVGSVAGAAANVAIASGNTGLFPRDAANIADCDAALKASYAAAYGMQAKQKRKRSAWRSALASAVSAVVVVVGLILLVAATGGLGYDT